jgi:hypothetical protein
MLPYFKRRPRLSAAYESKIIKERRPRNSNKRRTYSQQRGA